MSDNPISKVRWRMGVDAGQNSVGLAAVAYEDDRPTAILSAVSWIHDSGTDPDGQVPKSRRYTAGVARRTRRLRRRKRQRLNMLRQILSESEITVPQVDEAQTFQAWEDRAALVQSYIEDEDERRVRLGRAFMHIAHYRGWRNPWWSISRLEDLDVPSESFQRMRAYAAKRFGVPEDSLRTIGELGALAASHRGLKIRPRTTVEATPKAEQIEENGWLFFERIRQEDILFEIRLICQTQGIDEPLYLRIRDAVLFQHHPYVKAESVGRDPFDKSEPRAIRATLEFQEFRIRDKVANLRITIEGVKQPLTPGIHEDIVNYLLSYGGEDSPYWTDIAEQFSIPVDSLIVEASGDGSSTRAPIDESTRVVLRAKKLPALQKWWNGADRSDRADLIAFLADPVESSEQSSAVAAFVDSLPEDEISELEKLEFKSGRSSYGRSSLAKMNEVMRESNCDLTRARQIAFGVDQYWTPPKARFDEQTGQPTVDRNLALVRRFLMTATLKWGPPERVVVEHSREAFMSAEKAREMHYEQAKNQKYRDQIREELRASGIANPSDRDIRRKRLMQIQNGICLYCGDALSWEGSELDHIVPRASGGSNRQSNLALVCKQCNSEKSRLPFARYAQMSSRVSLDGALGRVKEWERIEKELTPKQFWKYKCDVTRRLRRLSDDEELDERTLASTAYAAREIRERVEDFLEHQSDYDHADKSIRVQVYNGSVTALARSASGIAEQMSLRGGTTKTRVDRRHHAVDAVVMTSISPAVARVLVQRDDLKRADRNQWTPVKRYKEYRGNFGDETLYRRWLENSQILGNLGRELIDRDGIAVARQLRLRPKMGALHLDTVKKLNHKRLGEQWSLDQVSRVVDPRIYSALRSELREEGDLPVHPRRHIVTGGRTVSSSDLIDVFPESAAMLAVQGGAVFLYYIHHVRVYAWRDKRGNLKYGIIRVFGGEFGRMGFRRNGIDLFTHPLPEWSESWRLAEPSVVSAIESGAASQIGWLSVGDEISFEPEKPLPGTGAIVEFSDQFPDRRWTLEGFPTSSKLRLRPAYISGEQITVSMPDLSSDVSQLISGQGWRPSVNVVLGARGVLVLRRTILGPPRWTGSPLPRSWSPAETAEQILR